MWAGEWREIQPPDKGQAPPGCGLPAFNSDDSGAAQEIFLQHAAGFRSFQQILHGWLGMCPVIRQ